MTLRNWRELGAILALIVSNLFGTACAGFTAILIVLPRIIDFTDRPDRIFPDAEKTSATLYAVFGCLIPALIAACILNAFNRNLLEELRLDADTKKGWLATLASLPVLLCLALLFMGLSGIFRW